MALLYPIKISLMSALAGSASFRMSSFTGNYSSLSVFTLVLKLYLMATRRIDVSSALDLSNWLVYFPSIFSISGSVFEMVST